MLLRHQRKPVDSSPKDFTAANSPLRGAKAFFVISLAPPRGEGQGEGRIRAAFRVHRAGRNDDEFLVAHVGNWEIIRFFTAFVSQPEDLEAEGELGRIVLFQRKARSQQEMSTANAALPQPHCTRRADGEGATKAKKSPKTPPTRRPKR